MKGRVDEQLLNELKAFRKSLRDHDSMLRSKEAIRQFFHKEGQEIAIKLVANTCASEIKVTVNGKEHGSQDIRVFDLNKLVALCIRKESK